jgi:septal ring-binding cell division protein DamX
VSATETPSGSSEPAQPPVPERHCRRCGATLGPDQEWCLACGAAVRTEVARPRGWRLPLVLAAAVVALAIAAAVLAIVELSRGTDRVAQVTPTPTPTVSPGLTPTPTTGAPENEGDQPLPGTTATPAPGVSATPSPGQSVTPSPSATATVTPSVTPSSTATSLADWPAGRTAWTIVLESATSRSEAEAVARRLQSGGDTVGVLHSNDHSSLRPGYWVVFSGQYSSRKAATDAMSLLAAKRAGSYVRRVSAT